MERIWCNHYRGMHENDTCKAGVPYDKFKGVAFDDRPCFCRPGMAPNPGCDLVEMPTAEQLAAEREEINRRFEQMGIARQAIVASLGGPWRKGTPGGSGVIDCPVCKAPQSLRFSRAGYNGHVHAACSTEGCVNWME